MDQEMALAYILYLGRKSIQNGALYFREYSVADALINGLQLENLCVQIDLGACLTQFIALARPLVSTFISSWSCQRNITIIIYYKPFRAHTLNYFECYGSWWGLDLTQKCLPCTSIPYPCILKSLTAQYNWNRILTQTHLAYLQK